jgi:ribosome-binding protein aMBF1 (putative translation factor)
MKMPNCEYCGKNIKGSKWNKEHHHINICQDPIKRFFCSRQCKINWIFHTESTHTASPI